MSTIRVNWPAIPLGRTGTANEIAKAVAFRAFGESSYITGSELFGRRSGSDLGSGL